jgi:hypothetical protein
MRNMIVVAMPGLLGGRGYSLIRRARGWKLTDEQYANLAELLNGDGRLSASYNGRREELFHAAARSLPAAG